MPTGKRDEYLAKTHVKKQADDAELKRATRSIKAGEWPERSHLMVPATQQLKVLGKPHNEKYNPKIVSKVTAAVKRKKDAAKLMEHAAEYAPSVEKRAAGGRIDGCAKRGKTRGKFV
jgi:hypothetical protein